MEGSQTGFQSLAMMPSPTLSDAYSPSKYERPFCTKIFAPIGPGSSRGALFNLSSSAIGAGLMSLPYAVANCGLVLGIILIIAGALSSALYYKVIIKGMEESRNDTFIGFSQKLFGNCAMSFVSVLTILTLFGLTCSYLVIFNQTIVNSFLVDIFVDTGLLEKSERAEYRIFVTVGITIMLLVPLSLPKHVTQLRYLSTICIIAILYLIIYVIVMTPIYFIENDISLSQITLFNFDRNIASAITIIFFSFNAITALPMVYSELQRKSYRKMSKIINRSLLMSGVMYVFLGAFGYLSSLNDIPELITNRVPPSQAGIDWPMIFAKILICMSIVGAMALSHIPLRLTVEQLIAGTKFEENPIRYWGINFTLLIGSMALALLVPHPIVYFKFIGGLCAIPLAVALPTFIFWKTSDNMLLLIPISLWSLVITLCGIASAVMTIIDYQV